ncbi:MAG: hypothetical protein FWE90_10855 [Defluviitaleaceae bacterium]|nr:hypothetical protein [Defluviitaleaceae bacterium]
MGFIPSGRGNSNAALNKIRRKSAPCAKWLRRLQAPDANHVTRPFADFRLIL